MSRILDDPSQWLRFFPQAAARRSNAPGAITESLPLDVLEFYSDPGVRPTRLDPPLRTAQALIERDRNEDGDDTTSKCSLRVVFLPRDPADRSQDLAYEALCRYYGFPSCWLAERVHGVTHSVGARTGAGVEVEVSWLRLLCKDVQIRRRDGVVDGLTFYHMVGAEEEARGGSQDSGGWVHFAAVMHVRARQAGGKCVTLFCFGETDGAAVKGRLEGLMEGEAWRDAVEEPYLLWGVLLETWYEVLDDTAWRLAEVFRPIELWTLRYAGRRRRSVDDEGVELDFTGLHNLSKHCIYLLEAMEAALMTVEDLATHHRFLHMNNSKTTALSNAAATSLTYRKTMFQSTQLRLRSLEKRMANLIGLSFNIVTQDDSRTLKNDSNAMKAIAVLTLIFLPLTGIGSVFSTPFFDVDFDSERRLLRVAQSFWIFWVITIPLTGIIYGAWVVWYYKSKSGTRRPDKAVASRNRAFSSRFHITQKTEEEVALGQPLKTWLRRPRGPSAFSRATF